jgi:hypothetical protein
MEPFPKSMDCRREAPLKVALPKSGVEHTDTNSVLDAGILLLVVVEGSFLKASYLVC